MNRVSVSFDMIAQLIKTIKLDDKIVKLQLWDTAGQERFRTITHSYYRGAHGIIVVYDVTNQSSFDAIRTWADDIDRYARENVPTLLVGNKSDLAAERVVSTEQGQDLADSMGMSFIETSAKTAVGVDDAFMRMSCQVKTHINRLTGGPRQQLPNTTRPGRTIRIDTPSPFLGRGCC